MPPGPCHETCDEGSYPYYTGEPVIVPIANKRSPAAAWIHPGFEA